MCAKRYVQRVSSGCICMAHESCQQRAKGYAPQPRPQTVAAIRSSAGCGRTDAEGFRSLTSSSLSLFAAGAASDTAGPRRRCQSSIHRQALAKIGSATSSLREPGWFVVERGCEPSAPCDFAAEKKAWLGNPHATAPRFIWNIASIGCSFKNLSRLTNFLFPRFVEQRDRWK